MTNKEAKKMVNASLRKYKLQKGINNIGKIYLPAIGIVGISNIFGLPFSLASGYSFNSPLDQIIIHSVYTGVGIVGSAFYIESKLSKNDDLKEKISALKQLKSELKNNSNIEINELKKAL